MTGKLGKDGEVDVSTNTLPAFFLSQYLRFSGIMSLVEKTIRKFHSFEEADATDAAYYRSLTPRQRIAILLELIDQAQPRDEAERRLERVYRIVELSES